MLLEEINKIIEERKTYGQRKEVTKEQAYLCIWSNAKAKWYIYSTGKGTITLDANEILIPKKLVNKKDLEYIFDNKLVNVLPLYKNSFEYKK